MKFCWTCRWHKYKAAEQMWQLVNKITSRWFQKIPWSFGTAWKEAYKTNYPEPGCSSCCECWVTFKVTQTSGVLDTCIVWKPAWLLNPRDCRKPCITSQWYVSQRTAYYFLSLHPSFVLLGMQRVLKSRKRSSTQFGEITGHFPKKPITVQSNAVVLHTKHIDFNWGVSIGLH